MSEVIQQQKSAPDTQNRRRKHRIPVLPSATAALSVLHARVLYGLGQVTENPIYMHCTKSDAASLRSCVDDAAAVGFEMVIISFGAG